MLIRLLLQEVFEFIIIVKIAIHLSRVIYVRMLVIGSIWFTGFGFCY